MSNSDQQRQAESGRGHGECPSRADAQSLAWAVAALDDSQLADSQLGGINVPLITMYGRSTVPEMPVAAARIVAAIPGAVEKEVPGAQHMWEPEPMAAELAAFVKSCTGAYKLIICTGSGVVSDASKTSPSAHRSGVASPEGERPSRPRTIKSRCQGVKLSVPPKFPHAAGYR